MKSQHKTFFLAWTPLCDAIDQDRIKKRASRAAARGAKQ